MEYGGTLGIVLESTVQSTTHINQERAGLRERQEHGVKLGSKTGITYRYSNWN